MLVLRCFRHLSTFLQCHQLRRLWLQHDASGSFDLGPRTTTHKRSHFQDINDEANVFVIQMQEESSRCRRDFGSPAFQALQHQSDEHVIWDKEAATALFLTRSAIDEIRPSEGAKSAI